MADVNIDMDNAIAAGSQIEQAKSDRDAMIHAYNGVTNGPLSILLELREANERESSRN